MDDLDDLIGVFSRIDDKKRMRAFFDEIFTHAERKDFSLRWALMKLLRQGMTQRKISSELGVSLCKITRGSKIIRNPKSVTNQILNRK